MSSWRSKSEPETPFHVVLDRLVEQAGIANELVVRGRAMPACDLASLAETNAPATGTWTADQMYLDQDWSDPALIFPAGLSVEDSVAMELQLSDDLEPAEIERRRRVFAYRNHPDRCGAGYQALALQRMTVANVLIDRALKAARSR